MAERQENSPYTLDAYNPFFTERKWTPFYKRHVFTGGAQTEQAANLITSSSFQKYWSGGGNQTDNISAVRVTSATRDRDITALSSNGKYDIDAKAPTPPQRPIPPEGIRNIDFRTYYNKEGYYLQGMQKVEIPWELRTENAPNRWGNMNYDWHPDSQWRPATMQGTYPQLTHEEHNWWKNAMFGGDDIDPKTGLKTTGYNELSRNYSAAKASHNSIPLALRNTAGSMVRDDRQLYSTLRYFTDGSGQGVYRGVNASTPENLAGLSSELSLYGRGSRFAVPTSSPRWQSNILFTSSPSAELAMDTRNSQRVLGLGDTYRLNERAIVDADPHFIQRGGPTKEYTGPLLDVAQQEPEAIALRKANIDEARRVGMIQRDTISGVDKNGKPWVDSRPTTRTTVYGPPVKGIAAEVALGNTLHYGGKTLGVAGAALEGVSIPWRKYQILNQMRAERGEAPMSEPYDINKFPEGGISDQIKSHMLATGEAFVNFGTFGIHDDIKYPEMREQIDPLQRGYLSDNGQRVPNWVPNLQSTYQDRPRYERQGVSFNHLYPKAPR